jgi:hypothetical protein
MRKKPTSAGELMRQLEADPVWVAKRGKRERERGESSKICRSDEAMLVAEVRRIGYDIDSVWDLVNSTPHPALVRRFVGRFEQAYPILVRHLGVPHHPAVREGIIRALTVKNAGNAVEAALFREFEKEPLPELRWALANALISAMPYHRRRKHPDIARVFKAGLKRGAGRLTTG